MSATPARALRAAGTVVVLLVALSACGTTPAAESVPGLADQLAEVDASIADENYAGARKALDALAASAARARVAGDLTPEQADRVLETAAAVLEALPEGPAEDDGAGDEPEGLPVPSPGAVLQDDDEIDEIDEAEDDEEPGRGKDKPKKSMKDKSMKDKSMKDKSTRDKSRD